MIMTTSKWSMICLPERGTVYGVIYQPTVTFDSTYYQVNSTYCSLFGSRCNC